MDRNLPETWEHKYFNGNKYTTSKKELLKLCKDKDWLIRCNAARNPNLHKLPINIIQKLATDESYSVRVSVSKNDNIPISILEILSEDYDPNIRLNLAFRDDLSRSLMVKLSEDEDCDVRLAIVRNPKTPANILCNLMGDDIEIISDEARNKYNEIMQEIKEELLNGNK